MEATVRFCVTAGCLIYVPANRPVDIAARRHSASQPAGSSAGWRLNELALMSVRVVSAIRTALVVYNDKQHEPNDLIRILAGGIAITSKLLVIEMRLVIQIRSIAPRRCSIG